MELPSVMASIEEDNSSSYGTGELDHDPTLLLEVENDTHNWMERLEEIKTCITALAATQNAILQKMETMEKVVNFVQEDMTWVRGDICPSRARGPLRI